MEISSWTKFMVMLMVCSGCIVLTAMRIMDTATCAALFGGAMGYVFGNGHAIFDNKKIGGNINASNTNSQGQYTENINL